MGVGKAWDIRILGHQVPLGTAARGCIQKDRGGPKPCQGEFLILLGLQEPYGLLFRRLKKKEAEQAALIEKLKSSLLQVRQLNGLIPICASCKRIRGDQGFWAQVEDYISQHSEAAFTHSICPECKIKLYPQFYGKD